MSDDGHIPNPFGDANGRTCIHCRRSKVKCDKVSPCSRCVRLKLDCIAQSRGRGRPTSKEKKNESPLIAGSANGQIADGGESSSNNYNSSSKGGGGSSSSSSSGRGPSSTSSSSSTGNGSHSLSSAAKKANPKKRSLENGDNHLLMMQQSYRPPPPPPSSAYAAKDYYYPDMGGPVGGWSDVNAEHQYWGDNTGVFTGGASSMAPPMHTPALRSVGIMGSGGGGGGGGGGGALYPPPPPSRGPSLSSSPLPPSLLPPVGPMGGGSSSPSSSLSLPPAEPLGGNAGSIFSGIGSSGMSLLHSHFMPAQQQPMLNTGGVPSSLVGNMDLHSSANFQDNGGGFGDDAYIGNDDAYTLTWNDLNEVIPPCELTDTMIGAYWKMNELSEISTVKAVVVLRHWLLVALDRGSTQLLRKTLTMAQGLHIDPQKIIHTQATMSRFQDMIYNPGIGFSDSPVPDVDNVGLPPFIRALTDNAITAVSRRTVIKGRNSFVHNERFSEIFMTSKEANDMYKENKKDVWSSVIHKSDRETFFQSVSSALFRVPTAHSGCSHILRCVDRRGCSFLALVYFRAFFKDGGDNAFFALSVDPLPSSRYMLSLDQMPGPTENGEPPFSPLPQLKSGA